MEASSCPEYEDYRGVVIDIALEDTSLDEPALVDEVRRHIRVCPHCQSEFDAYRRVVTLFTPPPVPEEEIEEIAENVRRHVLAKVYAYERRRRVLRWAGSAAAVVALAVTAVAFLTRSPSPQAVSVVQLGTQQPQRAPPEPHVAPNAAGAKVVPRPALPPAEATLRNMLLGVACVLSEVQEPLRGTPTQEAIDKARGAIRSARELIERAPGTPEARRARYCAFRYYQLLGEHGKGEEEFETYIREVASAEGVPIACKVLDEEGLREENARNYRVAFDRFWRIITFENKGERAAIAYARIANVHAWLHQGEFAKGARLTAIKLGAPAPYARSCYRDLLRVALCEGRHDEASGYAKALIALPGSDAEKATDETAVAMAVEKAEGPASALQAYRRIVQQYPERYTAAAKKQLKDLERRIADSVLQHE